jgi:hypothetical protein
VSALSSTNVRAAHRTVRARHTRAQPLPHLCAGGASRYVDRINLGAVLVADHQSASTHCDKDSGL